MSEITNILSKLNGTREAEILIQMEENYESIKTAQKQWYIDSGFSCPGGCGECCRNFEPDLLECEALYMGAWLIENQRDIAEKVANGEFPFPRGKACQFWNEAAEYHCSIYEGRPSICRLFGASCNLSKNNEVVWKPCKFYPIEKLKKYNPELEHKQYSAEETVRLIKSIPPVMSNLMETTLGINPDNKETFIIREILPQTIKKLLWICQMNEG